VRCGLADNVESEAFAALAQAAARIAQVGPAGRVARRVRERSSRSSRWSALNRLESDRVGQQADPRLPGIGTVRSRF